MQKIQDEITEEWVIFRTKCTSQWLNGTVQQGHVNMAVEIIFEVLTKLFHDPSPKKLLSTKADAAFFSHISSVLHEVIAIKKWSRATCKQIVRVVHMILKKINIPNPIIRSFKLAASKKTWNTILGKKYGRLSFDNPIRMRLESWMTLLQKYSRNQSQGSLKNVMHFYLTKLLPGLEIDPMHFPEDNILMSIVSKKLQDVKIVESICDGNKKKHYWIELFLKTILKLKIDLPDIEIAQNKKHGIAIEDGDMHVIESDELEKINEVAMKDLENEMFFLTLITTGMRIGAYVNMKIVDIAELVDGKWKAKTQGRTIEKGPKIFTFLIHPRVRELLSDWLNKKRGFDPCEYVFPGKFQGPRTTAYFRKRFNDMCKSAGLKGKQFHPHSLRHSFAHMLLKSGNSVDIVSKLINHNSATTTTKYYLKESAAEVTERANIPWMPKLSESEKRKDILPKFLNSESHKKQKKDLVVESTKNITQLLKNFNSSN